MAELPGTQWIDRPARDSFHLSFAAGCIAKERKALKTGTGVRKLLEREAYRTAKEHGLMETLRMLIRALKLDGTVLEALNDITVQEILPPHLRF